MAGRGSKGRRSLGGFRGSGGHWRRVFPESPVGSKLDPALKPRRVWGLMNKADTGGVLGSVNQWWRWECGECRVVVGNAGFLPDNMGLQAPINLKRTISI